MQPEVAPKFECYSDDVRHAMRIANREAKRHLQPLIDTPHLLIALVREQTGLAGILLRRRGLTAARVRQEVRRASRRGWTFSLFIKLPLMPRLEDVIAHADAHAVAEKHESVGTGGVLLAMMRHDELTSGLLRTLGIDVSRLEEELAKYLHRFMVEAPGQVLHLDPDPAELPAA